MIDLHCHIIPDIDDGPRTIEESLAMADIAEKDGITTIVATPHYIEGLYQTAPFYIFDKLKKLNELLKANNIKLELLPGSDLHISHEIVDKIENNEFLTINHTKYVLIEFPSQFVPERIRELLKKMLNSSLIPIISHPERNYLFQRSPHVLFDFIKDGSLAQLTAMSITGEFGYEIKKFAKKLIANRLVHIIASDAHSKAGRPPILSKSLKAASKIVSPDEAYDMVNSIPELIIRGEKFSPPPPEKIRKFFDFFNL